MKKLIALIVAVLMIAAVLSGCNEESARSYDMFENVDFCNSYGEFFSVVYHTESKVMYSVSGNGALTLLVNPDGTPMIWHGDE